jgi:hypothetical protein
MSFNTDAPIDIETLPNDGMIGGFVSGGDNTGGSGSLPPNTPPDSYIHQPPTPITAPPLVYAPPESGLPPDSPHPLDIYIYERPAPVTPIATPPVQGSPVVGVPEHPAPDNPIEQILLPKTKTPIEPTIDTTPPPPPPPAPIALLVPSVVPSVLVNPVINPPVSSGSLSSGSGLGGGGGTATTQPVSMNLKPYVIILGILVAVLIAEKVLSDKK